MSLSDFKDLMLPWRSKGFFRRVHPRPVLDNVRYVLILGISVFIGYFLLYGVFGAYTSAGEGPVSMTIQLEYSIEDSTLMALDHYIYAVSTPIILGFLVSFFGKRISGLLLWRLKNSFLWHWNQRHLPLSIWMPSFTQQTNRQ